MKLWPVILALPLFLGACGANAVIQGDIQADATSAAVVAKVVDRPGDVPCLHKIGVIAGVAKTVQGPAVLTSTEIALGSEQLAQNQCAPLLGAVLMQLVQHAPVPVPVP